MQIELAWGYVRRWWLTTFRKRYVDRMRSLRRGDRNVCPFDPVDPRDVKFYSHQNGYWWSPEDDPFAWRNRLPFVRWGLCELLILGGLCAAATGIAAAFFWPLAIIPAAMALLILWFFRNPRRTSPEGEGIVIAPADGRVVAIEQIEYEESLGGPAVNVAIFLSLFNVHVNRAPDRAKVVDVRYRRGKFFNAMRPEASRENEQVALLLELPPGEHERMADERVAEGVATSARRRMLVRQITGAVARRIVCAVGRGAELERGEAFGMIKLGSRTELVLPVDLGWNLQVEVGDRVKAGESILATFTQEKGCDFRKKSDGTDLAEETLPRSEDPSD